MSVRERFAHLLIDTAGRLAGAPDEDTRWQVITDICGSLGATSVNSAGFVERGGQMAWMRSTIPRSWMEEYHESGLGDVDAILAMARRGRLPAVLDMRRLPSFGRDAVRRTQLDALREGSGMRYCLAATSSSGGLRRMLAITTSDDPRDIFGKGAARAFATIGTLLSMQLSAPRVGDTADLFGGTAPRPAEEDLRILRAMAGGRGLLAVSAGLGMGPGDLRLRLREICAKLQVSTHEEALEMAQARGLLQA
ncbi:autoinducer binding domain-containing protein [Mangrovicoccus algicola]|uniref:Autoinducer binding domain-containing protein n=1 Tax=Mangrovicoccus algicola TaxID=2771008 RepID=A0A8J6YSV5_9RHOB|nr:autoinducer binding domain-containing protein [Mangrovicoccus algicola]MBE3636970.1 autoinducer binding domain-containing protein [Mangrovicoccus algicola]